MFSKKPRIKDPKVYLTVFVVTVLSVYGLYLRIMRLVGHTFTPDEGGQIAFINMPFLDFVKNIPNFEFCSYVNYGDYFLTWPFFRIFPYNVWGLAIPHIIVTVLGFYLLYLICKLYFKTIWAYIITFTMFCFNATLIIHATELRPYASLPTLALAAFYFSQLVVGQPNISTKKKWLFAAFSVLVIWFHVYGVAMFISAFVFSLLSKRCGKSYRDIIKSSGGLFLLIMCIAMPLWILGVFGKHKPYRIDVSVFDWIANPLVDPVAFLKTIFGNLMGNKKLYPLLIGIIFPFIIPYKDRYKQIAFLFIIVFTPILLIFLSDLKTNYYFIQRQYIWVMPFFAFFIGWTWDSFGVYVSEKIKGVKKTLR